MKLLIQTQLSNYDVQGHLILECDSGWQMCINRAREMLKLNPTLRIDIMGPKTEQLITHPYDINPDLWNKHGPEGDNRLRYVEHRIIPNALVTRYDFDWNGIAAALDLSMHKTGRRSKYDAVYINDPMHLRNFKALFHIVAGYTPKFAVHSHFIDDPSCPKFPKEASLWLGQCEAAMRADVNFWQCESAMEVFFNEARDWFTPAVVHSVRKKSQPWDDGYSIEEITTPIDESKIRFDTAAFRELASKKSIVFVPNRIGGKGRSSDYTNCGKFMFDVLPELHRHRIARGHGTETDFVVVAGNPSQKFSNQELIQECGRHGYVSLVPDAFNRDEFKFVASNSHVAMGLYDQDAYGGTVARECIELGCLPLWLDNYEYASIAQHAGGYPFMAKADFSDLVQKSDWLLDAVKQPPAIVSSLTSSQWLHELKKVVRRRCSYEHTTPSAMKLMGIL